MHSLQRRTGILFALFGIFLLASADHSYGQTSGSGLEGGLQILQGLSPEQRAAISQQLGGGGLGSSGQGTLGTRQTPLSEEQQNLMLQQQREQLLEQQKQRTELDRLSPFLRADDWVVITIDSVPLPGGAPAAPSAAPAAPTSLLGALSATQGSQQQNILANPALALAQGAGGQSSDATASAQSQLSAATAAANAPQPGQSVTAGGYTPTPNCAAGLNCDASQLAQPELTAEQRLRQRQLVESIRSKNPYQLSHDGMLLLPGFAPIPLGGLTEQLATLRLGVEPALRDLYIRVTKLPLLKSGMNALKPFGYDLFEHPISTFAPATNVPVPPGYVIGPGDELEMQWYGSKNLNFKLMVQRDGHLNVPELGPINVAGQTFASAKSQIESRVEKQMVGVRANVTMADTRTVRVFVLGAAKVPGSYTISGLGTITSALFAAGGVQQIGSLRTIQLKRRGELIRQLDLYDMLIRGDTSDDARLLPDDVVFIPAVGPTVSVDGEVHRPAIYELRRESSIAEVIQLAGGLTPEADTEKLALTRIDDKLHRVVLQVALTADAGRSAAVRNGDSLRVARLRPTLDAGILVQGHVYTPGAFAYRAGMRLTDIIRSVDDLRPNADLHYILIRREVPPDRRVSVLSADLDAALREPGSDADVPLMARDRIIVFDLQSSRDRVIRPLIEDLREQSNIARPEEVVRINGRANVPGEYPLETGMTVRDLIRAGGGLSDAAYGGTAELTRYRIVNGESRQTDLIKVDLAAALRSDPAANIRLEPFDVLSIKEVESWTDQETILVRGQVKFPGVYSVKPGETLKSVLLRAGGLTQYAFPEGSVFIRRELREREQHELDMLANRMQNDIAFVALEGSVANQAGAASALSVGQSLLSQLRQARAVGRLVINLPRIMQSPVGSQYDVTLRDGDEIIVPKQRQEVTVIGEVQSVSSQLWHSGVTRDDYIAMSGGETRRADHGRIYIVRADGGVVAGGGSRWFHTSNEEIKPGDTVVVPLNAEHIPALPFWQAVTQILYNVAVAFLAVHSATG